MLKLVILLLIFIPSIVFGNNFQSYLSYVNKAEISITHDDYKKAQSYYDTAFHLWDKPFAIDLYNDLRCANIDSDYMGVRSIAKKMMALGCTLSFFDIPSYLSA